MAASRLLFFLALTATAADLEISRPARDWAFLDAAGPKASILGHEDGVLEAFVYPLKIFKNFRLRVPAVTRRIVSRPGIYTIIYSGDDFEIRQTLAASV